MKHRFAFALTLVAALLSPLATAAQVGLAARVGTLGVGGELALGLHDRFVLRGGVGASMLNPSTTFDDVSVDLTLPERWYNVGADLYLNGAFRIGGGLLFRSGDPTLVGNLTAPTDIGGLTFTPSEVGTLTGVIESKDRAGYALIGFGKHTASGLGLSLDLGVALMGDPNVTLTSQGGTYPDQVELSSRLTQEAQNFEDDIKTYLRFWPILSLGLRYGVGG